MIRHAMRYIGCLLFGHSRDSIVCHHCERVTR
jgi:hypothetical protein